jgi:hypothetical protein
MHNQITTENIKKLFVKLTMLVLLPVLAQPDDEAISV